MERNEVCKKWCKISCARRAALVFGTGARRYQKSRSSLPVGMLLGTVLGKLSSGKKLAPLVNSVEEQMGVDGVHVFDRNVRMVFLKSAVVSRELCSSLHEYGGTLKRTQSLAD